jgi:hypothetical protein
LRLISNTQGVHEIEDRQRRCELERALGGVTWCVEKKTIWVMESSVAAFNVLSRMNPALVKFNTLTLK